MNNRRLIITIDGPSASGKSTTARLVAERLGYRYIDSGAMYRAITLAVLRAGIRPEDREQVELLASEVHVWLDWDVDGQHTYISDEDVSDAIRSPEVTSNVSVVSAYPGVRHRMVAIQREFGTEGGVVVDGRDIGTVVFPNADVKVYLIAEVRARAERRLLEIAPTNPDLSIDVLVDQLSDRDLYDSGRDLSPLRKADDAVEIDNSGMSIEDQVDLVVKMAERKMNAHGKTA